MSKKVSKKAIKAELTHEIASRYKRQMDVLRNRLDECISLNLKYKAEIAKLQRSLEEYRNKNIEL